MNQNYENSILKALKMEGVDAEQITVTKNGIPCKGIRIITGDGQVSPVVYYSEEETITEFVARVRRIMNKKMPSIRLQQMTDWKYVKKNLFLSLAKRSDESVVKRPYLNLELQIRLRLDLDTDMAGSIRVTDSLVEATGVSKEEFWTAAEKNTADAACVCSMMELLGLDGSTDDVICCMSPQRICRVAQASCTCQSFSDSTVRNTTKQNATFCRRQRKKLSLLPVPLSAGTWMSLIWHTW